MRTCRRLAIAAVAAIFALLLLLASCGDDPSSDDAGASTPALPFPPNAV